MKTICFIGLGLIGGSLALSLRKNGKPYRFIGVDKNEVNAQKAVNLHIVDETMPLDKAMFLADIVIISIPVDQTCRLLPEIMNKISTNTIVADMGSTKAEICRSIENHPLRRNFVASHPIAGTENSGPEAAFADLFIDKLNIICDKEKSSDEAVATIIDLTESAGMHTTFMQAVEHDLHLAYVSHLSHISSFTLGLTVLEIEKEEKHIFDLAGSGFASTVRLAKSSPEMWTPILLQNADNLSQALAEYIDILVQFKTALDLKNSKKIKQLISESNQIRRVLEKK